MIQRDPDALLHEAPQTGALADYRHLWLVGIEGVGLSGAARLLRARGHRVGGCDANPGPRSQGLRRMGIDIAGGEGAEALPVSADLVVRSAAVPDDHPQIEAARVRGLPVWKYAQLVGALMQGRLGICVAGCHGKTTTSSLLADALLHAEADPTFVIGGDLCRVGTGARHGSGETFVVESCEFDRSFHAHRPLVAIVTNVDEDHLDYYEDLAEIQESFRVFASRLPTEGVLIVNDPFAALFTGDARITCQIERYGFGADADWRCGEPHVEADGGVTFTLKAPWDETWDMRLPLVGHHNVLNATAAAAAMYAAGFSATTIRDGLAGFQGVGRRLEHVASTRGIDIVDDYGHHPAEIRAVLRALRARYGTRRLRVVFQPHQASRTRCLLAEFAATLAAADEVWMPPIFFARDSEEERRSVTSEDLVLRIQNEGGAARAFPDLSSVVAHAAVELEPGDVLVTMGAGNVDEVAHGLAERLR